MNRTPEPSWSELPDEILSTDVARLFGILPKSLSQYAKRNQIAQPVRREANAAWYAKADVQAFWQKRERSQVQFYSLNDLPAPLKSEAVSAAVSALAGKPDDSLTVSPDELRGLLEAGITAGVTAAVMPLTDEIKALREEVAGLRGDIAAAKNEPPTGNDVPPTTPPTFWQRLLGG